MPMRGAAVSLTHGPSFPYLHFPMYHLKRAADGFTDICQDIPRGRHRKSFIVEGAQNDTSGILIALSWRTVFASLQHHGRGHAL